MARDAVFKALSDPTRRQLLRMLRRGDMTAGELSDRFDRSRSTLSEHLAVLRVAGLVVTERNGTTIVYSLNESALEEILSFVMDTFGRTGVKGGRR